MEEAEDTSDRHACEFDGCPKSYSTLGNMRTHLKTHTGDLAYKCVTESCGKAFLTSYSLRVHARSHTGEKPYICDDQGTGCRRAFASLYRLRAHKRVHTGDLYQCSQCAKSFITRGDLRKHERTHSGARPFSCVVVGCVKAYTTLHHLKVHARKHDSAQEADEEVSHAAALAAGVPLLEPIAVPPRQQQMAAGGAERCASSPARVPDIVAPASASDTLETVMSDDGRAAMDATSFDISDVMSILEGGASSGVGGLEYGEVFGNTFAAAAAGEPHPEFAESLDLPPPLTSGYSGNPLLLPEDMLGISSGAAMLRTANVPVYSTGGGMGCASARCAAPPPPRAACCQVAAAPVTACCGNPFPTPPPSCCLPDCKCCCCLPHKSACRPAVVQQDPVVVAPSPLILDGLV